MICMPKSFCGKVLMSVTYFELQFKYRDGLMDE